MNRTKKARSPTAQVWTPVPGQNDLRRIFGRLMKQFPAVEELRLSGVAHCLDTFDWKVLGKGMLLMRTSGELGLFFTDEGNFEAQTPITGRVKPLFWHDLPEGQLQRRIKDTAGIRSLLPAGTFRIRFSRLSLQNDDEETICRLQFAGTHASPRTGTPKEFCGIRVLPVKGHRKVATAVTDFLAESGLSTEERILHPFLQALHSCGREPFDYSSKISLNLDPEMTAAEAARKIHLTSLETAERNIPGMIDDLDVEFLHDFRVSLRRNRSALSLIKDVFPAAGGKNFQEDLRTIQKTTNRLRDLDVHIMEEERFQKLIPKELHVGLTRFFCQLREERHEAFEECREFLRSEVPQTALRKWREYFRSAPNKDDETPKNAPLPVQEVARKLLAKRFRRILRDGRKIDQSSPDSQIHDLRIQFKKLRYLMEFFGTLFPSKKITFLVGQCRKLQNTLGRFNDLVVQEEWVARSRSADQKHPDRSMETSASLGALLTELRRAQRKERKRFHRAFRSLDNSKVGKTVSDLF